MKISLVNPGEKEFQPFTLHLTLEKMDEAAALHAIFNHAGITNVLARHGIDDEEVRSAICKAIGGMPDEGYDVWAELCRELKKGC